MKRLITVLTICFSLVGCFPTLLGQTNNAIKEINSIKRFPDQYIYAEGTSATWEEALGFAKTLLSANIEMWAKEEAPNDDIKGYIAKANEHLFEIKATRGKLFRAFVYVSKKDLLPYTANEKFMVVPVNEETKVEVSQIYPEDNAMTNVTVIDSSITVESKIDGVWTKNQLEEDSSDLINDNIYEKTPEEKYEPSERELRILQVEKSSQINEYIIEMQSQNLISAFGKFKDMPQDKDCYLFVYNKKGDIPAHLHKVGDKFINVKSGQEDNITNYKGCGAFWFYFR